MITIDRANQSLNARNTSLEQVAHTFVRNDRYDGLRKGCHNVLLGPRGSGKTTLFKMLTKRAISRWNLNCFNQEDRLEDTIFMTVYIPADIHWNMQINAIWKGKVLGDVSKEKLARAAMNIGIVRAVIDAIEAEFEEDSETACELAVRLAQELSLPINYIGFPALKVALAKLRMKVSRIANINVEDGSISAVLNELPEFCCSDYLVSIRLLKEVSSAVAPSVIKFQWALCFDELEICPPWLQRMIVAEMRSTDQDILFKLSASPIPANFSETFADHLNDFIVIKMWPSSGSREHEFPQLLATSWLSRALNREFIDCNHFFGASRDLRQGYEEGEEGFEIISEVAKVDKQVFKFIQAKELNPRDLAHSTQAQRDAVLRKLRPVCLFRHAYLAYDKKAVYEKSLKRPPTALFSGFSQILLISDFNPRRLVVILERMLSDPAVKSESVDSIPKEVQVRVLQTIGHEFAAYLASFPDSLCKIMGNRVSLVEFLRTAALFFRSQLLGNDINIDPVGTFSVPEGLAKLNPSLCEMIRKAAWLGAVVSIDGDAKANPLDGKVERRSFRISYTLAPIFGLLLRASKSRGIQHCIKERYPIIRQQVSVDNEQVNFEGEGF